MSRKLYEVKTSGVKRITARHHVFAESSTEAVRRVLMGEGERIGHADARWVETPSHSVKKVRS
jgi:hypothetical protein